MKTPENTRIEDKVRAPKEEWVTPAVEVIDIESGVIAGPEGAITGGGLHVGVDSWLAE